MLKVENLCSGYGPVQILHGVSLEVAPGEVVALLGSNGMGKSTLNNTLSGVCRATAGQVVLDGKNLTGASPDEIVSHGLIHVPEGRRVFPNLTILENLELGSYRRAKSQRKQNLEKVFEIFPKLRERVAQKAGTLSGGEQQMLAIGRGLMAEPKLLILDEPSLGLSPLMVEQMFELIVKLHAEGLSILLVEQNVMQSLQIADRAYVLDNGKIAMSGPAQQLLNDPGLRTAYLGM